MFKRGDFCFLHVDHLCKPNFAQVKRGNLSQFLGDLGVKLFQFIELLSDLASYFLDSILQVIYSLMFGVQVLLIGVEEIPLLFCFFDGVLRCKKQIVELSDL
ncbi:hypothetical protein SDC9_87242 [bioreactor metagenome]|uniref:Uncharacterized protein n=1 Tax=bioreactor metagenome TaxID=1076179 RepID=A0A644ZJU8_9ZZZZ